MTLDPDPQPDRPRFLVTMGASPDFSAAHPCLSVQSTRVPNWVLTSFPDAPGCLKKYSSWALSDFADCGFLERSPDPKLTSSSKCGFILWCSSWWSRWKLSDSYWVYGQWVSQAIPEEKRQVLMFNTRIVGSFISSVSNSKINQIVQDNWSPEASNISHGCCIWHGVFAWEEYSPFRPEVWESTCEHEGSTASNLQGLVPNFSPCYLIFLGNSCCHGGYRLLTFPQLNTFWSDRWSRTIKG